MIYAEVFMKYLMILLVLLSLCSLTFADSGLNFDLPDDYIRISGKADNYYPPYNQNVQKKEHGSRENWTSIQSYELNTLIRPNYYLGVQFNTTNNSINWLTNYETLAPQAITAIEKTPYWIRADLENILRQLSAEKQIHWANVINNALDPYIDEIAFCVAHSSVLYLESDFSNPQLFIDNANLLYDIDQDLDYVQIMDHGSSSSDQNYYSTTKYKKMNANGQISEIEVPKEIYYWYIVHPKTSDEIPAYINPMTVEDNTTHVNNITTPGTGKFWRQLFFFESDAEHQTLASFMDSCQVVWNPNNSMQSAVHGIQNWINSFMSFTSNSERPHQPVRIYQKGFGRCGEYGDITMAATRTALIPCTSILSASTDHVWNEFWDEGWHQWEPVNHDINNPLVYENGWGKVFGSVMEIRSDGYLNPVTDTYSEGSAEINIFVFDNNNQPIDGASVKLAINDNNTIRFDALSYTNNDGLCKFIVGDNRHYYVHVDTPVGSNPIASTEYLDCVENSVDGSVYNFQVIIDNTLQFIDHIPVDPPADNADDYRMVIDVNSSKQVISGLVAWDDIDYLGERPRFYKDVMTPGKINVHFMSYDQYGGYQLPPFPFESFNSFLNVSQANTLFNYPANYNGLGLIDNFTHLNNLQFVSGEIRIEQHSNNTESLPSIPNQLFAFPNPFKNKVSFTIHLTKGGEYELNIYNIKGQLVHSEKAIRESGSYSHQWNTLDNKGQKCPSGIYFAIIKHSSFRDAIKLILIR